MKNQQQPIIKNPCSAMYGVSIKDDGTIETIGIGIIDTENAEAIAECLEQLAEAIRSAAKRRF